MHVCLRVGVGPSLKLRTSSGRCGAAGGPAPRPRVRRPAGVLPFALRRHGGCGPSWARVLGPTRRHWRSCSGRRSECRCANCRSPGSFSGATWRCDFTQRNDKRPRLPWSAVFDVQQLRRLQCTPSSLSPAYFIFLPFGLRTFGIDTLSSAQINIGILRPQRQASRWDIFVRSVGRC